MIAGRLLSRVLVSLCVLAGGLLSVWSAPALAQRKHSFGFSFGGAGSGAGQLSRPGALAVNNLTGDVYVLDRGNGRVEIFSSTGAYISQFNGSASPTGAFSLLEEGGLQGGIAVDDSVSPSDPSAGDVYVMDSGHRVIDKFTSSGAYIGQVVGLSPLLPFTERSLDGIAVDPSDGSLWVETYAPKAEYNYETLAQFDNAVANEYTSNFIEPRFPYLDLQVSQLGSIGFAFDSEGNLFLGESLSTGPTVPAKFTKAGELLFEALDKEAATALAVDLSSNDVYVDNRTGVAVFGPLGAPIEQFGAGEVSASEGIAVNTSTGTVYASNASTQEVDAFTAFVVPDATTGSVSSLGETSATVGGEVNPEGTPVTACAFEYGTSASYGQSVPCAQTPAQIGSGSGPVAVSAELKGLGHLSNYHFRLSVSNAKGSDQGRDRELTTPEPVKISEAGISDVSSESALFGAQIDPGGADTTYHVEYGPTVSYGESVPVPAGDLGNGTVSEPVAVRAQHLLPETTYHARFVASNVLGTVDGPDETFTTQSSGGAFTLPDDREWELVSPPNKYGSTIQPLGEGNLGMIESSEDGSAISYPANGPIVANPQGNPSADGTVQVFSRRGPGGWTSEDASTPHNAPTGIPYSNEYLFFSPDLSRAVVEPRGETPLSPEATGETAYVRNDADDSYQPLVTAHDTPPGTRFGERYGDQYVTYALVGSPDLSHVVLHAESALLTSNAILPTFEHGNLFEWSNGRLQLVNVLRDGAVTAGGFLGDDSLDMRNAISSDGTRVFWTEGFSRNGPLYMRDTATDQTVQVDAPAPGVSPPPAYKAQFQMATPDGSKVFFLEEEPLTLDSTLPPTPGESEHDIGPPKNSDLYMYDTVTGKLTDLSVDHNTGEQANVQNMVLGASEDGSIVYFVATGVLATGAQAGKDNLYVASETGSTWSTRLVAVLAEGDANDWGFEPRELDTGNIYHLVSNVSPNGRYLAFMSEKNLTGYDNRDAISGQPDQEVFLYDEATGQLRCVSCNPTGARPEGVYVHYSEEPLLMAPRGLWESHWVAATIPAWSGFRYQSRVLSDEGRLFFDSADALAAQDTNGKADVYEYEPQGVGSCVRAGCLSLISSGTSAQESTFMDASRSGNDVYFITTSRLVPQDYDTAYDVYDAHVCSDGVPCLSTPVSPPPCTSGDSCKPAPAPQPAAFGAPASATFSGAGNITPSAQTEGPAVPRKASKPRRKGPKKGKGAAAKTKKGTRKTAKGAGKTKQRVGRRSSRGASGHEAAGSRARGGRSAGAGGGG